MNGSIILTTISMGQYGKIQGAASNSQGSSNGGSEYNETLTPMGKNDQL